MTQSTTDDLLALISRELKIDASTFNADTPIFEGGLELDSFAVVDLVTRIENHFGIQLSDDDFRPENFADFKTLGGVVEGYVNKAPSA